jgi:SSS family solute:Na+ symporter
MNWLMIFIFLAILTAVSIIGFLAARWRPGDMNRLQEWGLAGRHFGLIVSWFLIGGDIYTAYSYMAVPGFIFGKGALGSYAIVYLTIMYPLAFLVLPKFWVLARHRGYVTAADFVLDRFDSRLLALLVAITGIVATLPYIALQIIAIEIVINLLGIPVEISLIIAFAILSAYTYYSGLRAPAVIAVVKDILIWMVVLVVFVGVSARMGGLQHVFSVVPQKDVLLSPNDYMAFITLALGSALAQFLYPHMVTGVLSINSHNTVKRSAALLPAYTILVGILTLTGFLALGAGVKGSPIFGPNVALPSLVSLSFPSWFLAIVIATITVAALVPSAIMSIAAANLFSRNIYRAYFRPSCTHKEEARVAKTVSLLTKFAALTFVLIFPAASIIINLQLVGGVWLLQTLPAVFLALYTRWFHRGAVLMGLICGIVVGSIMVFSQNFDSLFPLVIGGVTIPVYAALLALVCNLGVCVVLTPVLRAMGVTRGQSTVSQSDFEVQPVQSVQSVAQR